MINPPLNIEEARKIPYGKSTLRPEGIGYKEGKCAFEVSGDGWYWSQCSFKNGKGPQGLYCGIHAKIVERKMYPKV